jgi:hypothetical protein
VTARFAAREQGRTTAQPQQTFAARVLAKGNRSRIETSLSDRPVVFLLAPPYAYKLLPQSKAGVRWRLDPKTTSRFAGTDLQTLLRNPGALRAALQKAGARRVGTAKMAGVASDIYAARNLAGQGGTAKVWLRRGDSLPLRLEATSSMLSTTVSWSNYRRGLPLSDKLFGVPAGYSVRDTQGQPRLF